MEQIPETKLVIIGDGPMRQNLENRVEKLDLSDKVRLAGPAVGDLKALYYKAADIFVLPSTAEVFSIVLLEASVAGLPIIVNALDTLKCFIEDGYNGIMVNIEDMNSLTETIIHLLSNPELRQKMRDNARERVKDYSWEKIARETEEVYKMVGI